MESNNTIFILSGILAVCLAITHIGAGKLRFLDKIPRSRWLSMASGVSVAYVFVHLLPDLGERQQLFSDINVIAFLEHHVYLLALAGLSIFYGLERMVTFSRQTNQEEEGFERTDLGIFWIHIASFSIYNALIGYLLIHREENGIKSLLLFFVAMALHFVVNDYGLRQDHKKIYHDLGRWILAGAIILGWVIGAGTKISEAMISALFAFLAGSVIFNVLKEELPEERQSRFWAFALGAGVYSILLLAI